MKSTSAILLTILLCANLLSEETATPAAKLEFTWKDPADPSIATVRQTGERAITLIADRLVSEVSQVLAVKSPEEAIDVLHLKSFTLPAAASGSPVVTSFKLPSLKVRAAANLPDNADLAALHSVRRDLENGRSPPKLLVQHIAAGSETPEEWRIYRPIGVTPSCVVCHGASDSLPPAVKTKLDQLYPHDKAVDYTARGWRGLIRVSVRAAQPAKS